MKPQHVLIVMIVALVFGFLTIISEEESRPSHTGGLTPCDSIREENFELEIRLNRYEVGMDILREEDSAAARKLQEIIETQTE